MSYASSGKTRDDNRRTAHLSPRACRRAIASARSIRLQVRTRMESTCHICLEGGGDIVRACETCTAQVHPACQEGWQRHLSPRDERRYRCSVCRTFFRRRPSSPETTAPTSPPSAAPDPVTTTAGVRPPAPRVSHGTLRWMLLGDLVVNVLLLSGFAVVQLYWSRTTDATVQRVFMTHVWLAYNCVTVSVSGAMSLGTLHLIRRQSFAFLVPLGMLMVLVTVAFVTVDLPTSLIAYFLTLFMFLAIFVRFYHAEPSHP